MTTVPIEVQRKDTTFCPGHLTKHVWDSPFRITVFGDLDKSEKRRNYKEQW